MWIVEYTRTQRVGLNHHITSTLFSYICLCTSSRRSHIHPPRKYHRPTSSSHPPPISLAVTNPLNPVFLPSLPKPKRSQASALHASTPGCGTACLPSPPAIATGRAVALALASDTDFFSGERRLGGERRVGGLNVGRGFEGGRGGRSGARD